MAWWNDWTAPTQQPATFADRRALLAEQLKTAQENQNAELPGVQQYGRIAVGPQWTQVLGTALRKIGGNLQEKRAKEDFAKLTQEEQAAKEAKNARLAEAVRGIQEAKTPEERQNQYLTLAVQDPETAAALNTAAPYILKPPAQKEWEQAGFKSYADYKKFQTDEAIRQAQATRQLNAPSSFENKMQQYEFIKSKYGEDAAKQFILGGGGGGTPSEDERKAAGWLNQAQFAVKNMEEALAQNPEADKPSAIERAAQFVPLISPDLQRAAQDSARQRYANAASSLAEAVLRAATGAGVTESEARQKIEELTPQFKDSPELRAQKRQAILMYIQSLEDRAGRAAPKKDAETGQDSGSPPPGATIIDFSGG